MNSTISRRYFLKTALATGAILPFTTRPLFDPSTRRIINHKFADQLLDGAPPRKDWEQFYKL